MHASRAQPADGPKTSRLWEIDLARTAATAMMIAYHAAYNVSLLGPTVDLDPFSGGWRALQVACGSTFLFLVGVSVAVSDARGRAAGRSGWSLYRGHLRRAAEAAAAAAGVTLATWIARGDDFVRFGVLHCIAVAIALAPFLLRLGLGNLVVAAAVLVGGLVLLRAPESDLPGLLALGVPPSGAAGVDWYPLLPWLSPVLVGLAVGTSLYPHGDRGGWGRHLPTPSWAGRAGLPGRHTLPIYLLHQPVLVPVTLAALALAGVEVSLEEFR